jgi:hypothetical protein
MRDVAKFRVSALPPAHDLSVEKTVHWFMGTGEVSKLRWRGRRSALRQIIHLAFHIACAGSPPDDRFDDFWHSSFRHVRLGQLDISPLRAFNCQMKGCSAERRYDEHDN